MCRSELNVGLLSASWRTSMAVTMAFGGIYWEYLTLFSKRKLCHDSRRSPAVIQETGRNRSLGLTQPASCSYALICSVPGGEHNWRVIQFRWRNIYFFSVPPTGCGYYKGSLVYASLHLSLVCSGPGSAAWQLSWWSVLFLCLLQFVTAWAGLQCRILGLGPWS